MKKHNKVFFCCGLAMLLSEFWKQWCLTYRLGSGQYNWWYFPFQLCSIPMYVCLLLPFLSFGRVRRALLTFLMDFGLLAGFFTFFDTSGLHYPLVLLTVHSYAWHILLILLGLYAGYINAAYVSYLDFLKAAGVYLACCLLATVLNLVCYPLGRINMFYISPHFQMSQKVFQKIALCLGNSAGIAIYICATVTGAWLVHLLWMCTMKKPGT